VDDLGVKDLLPVGEPRARWVGEGADHLKARCREVEQVVEGGEVLAQASYQGRVQLRFGKFGQHHCLAPAVDPAP
jgi:hypothetical protein